MGHEVLLQVLLLLGASVALVAALQRLSLPPSLGYLLVGVAFGPHALALVPTAEGTELLAEFGVVFLLFMLGLEFSLPRMVAMRTVVFGLGTAQVTVTTLAFALAAWLLGATPGVAVVLGGAFALSSTAIVVKQLAQQLELGRPHGQLAVGILLFQDLAAVPFLVLIPVLAAAESGYGAARIAVALAEGALVVAVVLAAGRWLLRPLFHEIARARSAELFTLAALLVVLGAAWATDAVGLSLALGAFLAGMMLAETEYRHQVESDVRPFRDILLGLFFVTVGMRLDVPALFAQMGWVALLTLGLTAGKAAVVAALTRYFAHSWQDALRTGLAVGQGGEFGLALLTLALQFDVLQPTVAQPLLAAIVLSMGLGSLIIQSNAAIASRLSRRLSDAERAASELAREDVATQSLAAREHVIICGYGRVGQNVARIIEGEGFEFIALDLDPFRVRAARQAGDSVYFGDASHAEILERVGLAHASAVVVCVPDPLAAAKVLAAVRATRHDVPVLVRTPDDTHFDLLQKAGATEVVPDTLEASLMLATHVLMLLRVPPERLMSKLTDIRNERYRLLRSVFRKEAARPLDASHAFREELHAVPLPAGAHAVGRSLRELALEQAELVVTAIRRDGIVGRQPVPETVLKEGDIVVLYGNPEALEHGETILLTG